MGPSLKIETTNFLGHPISFSRLSSLPLFGVMTLTVGMFTVATLSNGALFPPPLIEGIWYGLILVMQGRLLLKARRMQAERQTTRKDLFGG
jgi:hypothetical protein